MHVQVHIFSLIVFSWNLVTVLAQEIESPSLLTLFNVSYGPEPEQIMDVYLPPDRDSNVSKVIVLIHGGGWGWGDKNDLNFTIPFFQSILPRHALVNINYRLGNISSPGFPKQIEDIGMALNYIKEKEEEWKIKPKFALVGSSAGAHLALLYSYKIDKSSQVAIVINFVGPADLTDPIYHKNPNFFEGCKLLVGNFTYDQNPTIYTESSPVSYIDSMSPKTLSFYGGKDSFVAITQGFILEDKLDSVGVYNKFYLYPDEGHFFNNPVNKGHYMKKISYFLKNYF